MPGNFKAFTAEVSAWTARLPEDHFRPAIDYLVMLFLREVIYNTPVVTGRLLGNWQVADEFGSIGLMDASLINYDKTGTATLARAMAQVPRFADGATIYVVNNLDYASLVEFGGPRNRAHHMVERALIVARASIPPEK